MKIIVSGDWHLGLTIGGYDCHDDIVRAVRLIITETKHADLFVFLGDMFHDNRPISRDLATAIELIDSVVCPAIYLTGNHDAGKGMLTCWDELRGVPISSPQKTPSPDALEPLRTMKWKREIWFPTDSIIVQDLPEKKKVLAVSYMTDLYTQSRFGKPAQVFVNEAFEGSAGVVAAFTHLDVNGAKLGSEMAVMRGGRLCLPNCSGFSFPILNGHIHKKQFIEPNLWLPGSVIATDFSDVDGEHGFAVVEV